MSGLELLKNHPKSAIVMKQWYLDKMLEGLNDDSIPDDFKELVRQKGIDDDVVAKTIDASPRALLDIFDEHKIYISTVIDDYNGFWWKIGEQKSTIGYEFRKNCDSAAITEAFKLLESKL